jgi:hypothetical protein
VPLNILVNGQPAIPRDGAIRLSPSPGSSMPASRS